jgi:prevent-host-death family protein
MKIATITEAKNGLSALLDRVRAGETILIVDRGVPVARLEPARGSDDAGGRIARLERAGILRPPTGPPRLDILSKPPPKPAKDADVVGAVLEERRAGR